MAPLQTNSILQIEKELLLSIKIERMMNKITQEEIGKHLGITKSAYQKKETGVVSITLREFLIILYALGGEDCVNTINRNNVLNKIPN